MLPLPLLLLALEFQGSLLMPPLLLQSKGRARDRKDANNSRKSPSLPLLLLLRKRTLLLLRLFLLLFLLLLPQLLRRAKKHSPRFLLMVLHIWPFSISKASLIFIPIFYCG